MNTNNEKQKRLLMQLKTCTDNIDIHGLLSMFSDAPPLAAAEYLMAFDFAASSPFVYDCISHTALSSARRVQYVVRVIYTHTQTRTKPTEL